MPQQHRTLHIVSEALAVFLAAPLLLYSTTKCSGAFVKTVLLALALATLAIDGYLLVQWLREPQSETLVRA